MEYNSSIDATKDAEFDQTAAEGACDAMAEANLKRMTYQIRHTIRVSRPFLWTDISLVSVRGLSAQAEMAPDECY